MLNVSKGAMKFSERQRIIIPYREEGNLTEYLSNHYDEVKEAYLTIKNI